jgi:hypothetical protein
VIGLTLGNAAAPAVGTGKAAAWMDVYDATDTHLAEPNVVTSAFAVSAAPTVNPNTRNGVPGLRGVMGWLNRTGIPLIPKGPPMMARRGQGMPTAGAQPRKVQVVQQFVPVAAVEQAGDWYQFLR